MEGSPRRKRIQILHEMLLWKNVTKAKIMLKM